MNALKDNKFLSGLLVITMLGVLGFGYLLYASYSKYAKAVTDYGDLAEKRAVLEGKSPYPNEENLGKLQSAANSYRDEAEALRKAMLTSQGEVLTNLSPTKFQDNLRNKVDEFVTRAQREGVKLPSTFYLGFEDYRTSPPLQTAAPRLQFQLDAICDLLRVILDGGSRSVEIKREKMDFERKVEDPPKGAKNKELKIEPEKALEPCEWEVAFTVGPAGYQQIMNKICNSKSSLGVNAPEYYFVPRFMRIDNTAKEGPPRTEPKPAEEPQEAAAAPRENEVSNKLNLPFGTESVRAYLALDLIQMAEVKATPKAAAKLPAKKI